MVRLTQVEDESAQTFEQPAAAAKEAFSDSDSDSEWEVEDDFDLDESLLDRIVALKDIIPPSQRSALTSGVSSVQQLIKSGLSTSGNFLWVLTSSALLLGVPAALAIMAESQIKEMEKELTLQQSAQDVLAPGSEGAFAEKKN